MSLSNRRSKTRALIFTRSAAGSGREGGFRRAAGTAEADQQADEEAAAENGRPALSSLIFQSLIQDVLAALF